MAAAATEAPNLTDSQKETFQEMQNYLKEWNVGTGGAGANKILPHVYLGDVSDAQDYEQLKNLQITSIINLAGVEAHTGERFYLSHGPAFKFVQFEAVDGPEYDIFQHYEEVETFLDDVKESGGRCLIHCMAGINRSGTLVTAYCMKREKMGFMEAVKYVKDIRGILMTNDDFQEQLLQFGIKEGLVK